MVLKQLHQHTGESEHGIGGHAFGIGQAAYGVVGPVDAGGAIDEIDGALSGRRIGFRLLLVLVRGHVRNPSVNGECLGCGGLTDRSV